MSEMVERVARALAEHGGDNWETCLKAPGLRRAGMYRSMARAAIEAMSEPTEAMLTYSTGDSMVHPSCHMCGGHLEGWKLMIEAALN